MQFNFGQRPFRHSDDRVFCKTAVSDTILAIRRQRGRLYMNTSTRIQWIRVLIGGFLAEASVFAIVISIFMISGQHALVYAAPSASLVMCFLSALWVGRRLESRFILHGMLVGVVATLLYVGLTLARPEPFAYLVAYGLKVLGGRWCLRGMATSGCDRSTCGITLKLRSCAGRNSFRIADYSGVDYRIGKRSAVARY